MAATFLDILNKARAARDPRLVLDAIPYARFLGMDVRETDDGGFLSVLPFDDMLIGNPMLPAIHGGVTGAFLENTAIVTLLWERDITTMPKTINITVEYLRSGRPRDTFAAGSLTRQGRRVATVRTEAWQDDPAQPIAVATAHFLLA